MSTTRRYELPPATGARLELARGETLRVIDVEGEQVADLAAFDAGDPRDGLSSGRTFDYNGTIFLSTGHALYSDRSRVMLSITEDTVGRHDLLYAPCSREMFALQYGAPGHHPSCLENLAACLEGDGIGRERIGTVFNIFMRVDVDPATGALTIRAPSSDARDYIDLLAERDLVVAVSACAAERTNQGRLKPIAVEVRPP